VSVSLGAVVEALKTRKLLTDEELAVAFRNLLKETSEELAKRMEETEKEIKEATSDK
jgi:transcription initiation factor IIE alpha subunit